MAAHDNDPPEFTGRDRAVKVDPVRAKLVAPHVAATPAPALAPTPAPVAEKPGSHLKHAVVRLRKNWEAAQAETVAARAELVLATDALRIAERAEGNALADWLALSKPPSAEEVYREHVARSQANRAAAVAANRNPDATTAPVISKSPIDQHAMARGKAAARSGVPLRSNVVRR